MGLAYLDEFLENVDRSGAAQVMLHFVELEILRLKDKTYSNNAYNKWGRKKGQNEVALAVLTTVDYVSERLTRYERKWHSTRQVPELCCGTVGVYTGFELLPDYWIDDEAKPADDDDDDNDGGDDDDLESPLSDSTSPMSDGVASAVPGQ